LSFEFSLFGDCGGLGEAVITRDCGSRITGSIPLDGTLSAVKSLADGQIVCL